MWFISEYFSFGNAKSGLHCWRQSGGLSDMSGGIIPGNPGGFSSQSRKASRIASKHPSGFSPIEPQPSFSPSFSFSINWRARDRGVFPYQSGMVGSAPDHSIPNEYTQCIHGMQVLSRTSTWRSSTVCTYCTCNAGRS